MADLKDFAEKLVNLTVKEVNELADILKDEYGIEPAAAAAPVMVAGGGAAGGDGDGGGAVSDQRARRGSCHESLGQGLSAQARARGKGAAIRGSRRRALGASRAPRGAHRGSGAARRCSPGCG